MTLTITLNFILKSLSWFLSLIFNLKTKPQNITLNFKHKINPESSALILSLKLAFKT
jgi:hypothetical protein